MEFKWAHMQKSFRNIPQTDWKVTLSQYNYEPGASHFNTLGFPQLGAQLSSEGSNTFNNLHGKFKPIREVRTHFAWLELAVCANSRGQGLKWGCRKLMWNKTLKRATTVTKPSGNTAEHNRGPLNRPRESVVLHLYLCLQWGVDLDDKGKQAALNQ